MNVNVNISPTIVYSGGITTSSGNKETKRKMQRKIFQRIYKLKTHQVSYSSSEEPSIEQYHRTIPLFPQFANEFFE